MSKQDKEKYYRSDDTPDTAGYDLTEECVGKDRLFFKAIPRLLDMIEPTDRAKAYTDRLADALEKEGYTTDANIVRERLRIMNGEKVAMATMDEESVSEDLEEEIKKIQAEFFVDKPHLVGEITGKSIEYIARHFANWQREKMMK